MVVVVSSSEESRREAFVEGAAEGGGGAAREGACGMLYADTDGVVVGAGCCGRRYEVVEEMGVNDAF